VRRRRESGREEWTEHIKLAALLEKYLDPSCTFWTSLENKPLSMLSGLFQKRRGVTSGLPDVLVVYRHDTGIIVIFIELKSRRGLASKAQKQLHLELLAAGAMWWMARSARAAMMALHLSGVVFRREWKPPQLQPWEGPFADPTERLPQHPGVAAEWREAKRRYRLRRAMRTRGGAGGSPGSCPGRCRAVIRPSGDPARRRWWRSEERHSDGGVSASTRERPHSRRRSDDTNLTFRRRRTATPNCLVRARSGPY
jgi:hypothetical protein